MDRVSLQWTDTAEARLAKFPPDARRGLLDKANKLRDATDLKATCRRLGGPLRDYYGICHSRYRAVYSMEREELPDGNALVHIVFRFATEGKRGEGSKEEIYRFAEKLLNSLPLDGPPALRPPPPPLAAKQTRRRMPRR